MNVFLMIFTELKHLKYFVQCIGKLHQNVTNSQNESLLIIAQCLSQKYSITSNLKNDLPFQPYTFQYNQIFRQGNNYISTRLKGMHLQRKVNTKFKYLHRRKVWLTKHILLIGEYCNFLRPQCNDSKCTYSTLISTRRKLYSPA